MKTTLDLPDDLYALVKARAALEGRTLRSVMEELLKGWVMGRSEERGAESEGEGMNEERKTKNERGRAKPGRSEGRGARGEEREKSEKRRTKNEKGGEVEEGKAGFGEEATKGLQPWEIYLRRLETIARRNAPIDEIAGVIKGPGPDLDLAKAREIYEAELAKEWKRRNP